MKLQGTIIRWMRFALCLIGLSLFSPHWLGVAIGQEPADPVTPTLEQVKAAGRLRSGYHAATAKIETARAPKPDLETFRNSIGPTLTKACLDCHGPETAEGDFRIDTLNPDLLHGNDVSWWLEVSAVVTNGEMPPADGPDLSDDDRNQIIQWLAHEIQVASQVHRSEEGHSSFRRMTRYEYNYALQDLLGLEIDFAENLPPEAVSEDGFQNSSEMLQITAGQYASYLKANRNALDRATVGGERPGMLYWGVSMQQSADIAIADQKKEDAKFEEQAQERAQKKADQLAEFKADVTNAIDEESKKLAEKALQHKIGQAQKTERAAQKKLEQRRARDSKRAYYQNVATGKKTPATWSYAEATYAIASQDTRPEIPDALPYKAVIPSRQPLVVELGNRLPDRGTMRVRVRASRVSLESDVPPSLALDFGWQLEAGQRGTARISPSNLVIDAAPGEPRFYQWDIPLIDVRPRNPVRTTVELGTPKGTNPSEYLRLVNTAKGTDAGIEVDYVEVIAPIYQQWPPVTHKRIFIETDNQEDEKVYAREIVSRFMKRAWRRPVTDAEVDSQMKFFDRVRPVCEDFNQAVVETLATVLSSPRFLYLVQSDRSQEDQDRELDQFELATRLAMFLWCSVPDKELLELATQSKLGDSKQLLLQTERMLADPRHQRFTQHFVRQWLDLGLLDYLRIDKKRYPDFDRDLIEVMQQEPIAMFEELLTNNLSVMDFLHCDYAVINEPLADHYGISDVAGNEFRKVRLKPDNIRGGLLTQAGLLAMNSDGNDSNPLKRGIWLLERVLNDPPPPPPSAVPEIDLADPEIMKMTLKERMEDHRSKPACYSCHMKIDPWGIALENFDAVGHWRTETNGKKVDATSKLFSRDRLDGIDGLKRYLLANRQDQFARAMVHKMASYALGRPLTFADRSKIEELTAELRKEGDGLKTLILKLVESDLFQKT